MSLAGAEQYKSLTLSHIRNADGAFIVYDISDIGSFKSIHEWKEIVKSSNNEDIVIFLLGNKKDLVNERKIKCEKGKNISKLENFDYFTECSAKTNENIMEMFHEFYKKVYEKNKEKIIEKRNNNKILFEMKQRDMEGKCCEC